MYETVNGYPVVHEASGERESVVVVSRPDSDDRYQHDYAVWTVRHDTGRQFSAFYTDSLQEAMDEAASRKPR